MWIMEKFDDIGRRHPGLALAVVVLLGLVAVFSLISQLETQILLYEGF
ncbi:MAG: hypothetical protein NTX50_29820 [Candidatus Sumerlaeota bacterium]|nr:hypothetical protein [Candidatus Sumerlaeota bacterium]